MSKKQRDWRKLAREPLRTPPADVDQPLTPIRRTYPIDNPIAKVVNEDAHGFHVFKYDEFMLFVDIVKQVHALNPDVLITVGRAGLFATAHGVETPREHKARLKRRAVWLQRSSTAVRRMNRSNTKYAETTEAILSQVRAKLNEKAKRKKRKKK